MLSTSGGCDRPSVISGKRDAVAGAPLPQSASGLYFGTLPTEVVGRIFLQLPIESPVHSALASRVCHAFATVASSHRRAASLYAGADLRRGDPGPGERVARVEETLAGLKHHAASIDDKHLFAILVRLAEQNHLVPVDKQASVWCQLLDARSCLPRSDRPGYVVRCLNRPVNNDLFETAQMLSSFRVILSTLAEAPANETADLLLWTGLALYHMDSCIQAQAFAELIAVCNQLDQSIRVPALMEAIGNIFMLEDDHQASAVGTVLGMLSRLHNDEIVLALKALSRPLTGLGHQQLARTLDAGIVLMAHLADAPRRAVFKLLAECVKRLPPQLNDKYFKTLLACRRPLST